MNRQQELTISLRDILNLIETNQLVRNPMTDDQPDWMQRMVKFVQVIKRAQDLVAPDLKDPAKVMPIDGCRFHSTPEDAIAATAAVCRCRTINLRTTRRFSRL
jgi:hypothetical protein